MSRNAVLIELAPEEESVLRKRVALRHAPMSTVQRARIVLAASAGERNDTIAANLGITPFSVALWRRRFAEERLAGLEDRPRSGRPATYTDADRVRVVETACTKTPEAETHWSVRSLAGVTGVGRETVHRLLKRADLKPHRVGTFSRSNDPDFVAKLIDVVGLYLDPPEHTIVLCVDEKTQVQALDRTQPLLPMRPGQFARRTHDYKRHGTVQLYAALEVQTGQVAAKTTQRHRSQEFTAFMSEVLRRSTYSSWLNLVEIFFNLLQAKVIGRGNFRSTKELVQRIMAYIEHFSVQGSVFQWTKPAAAILQSLNYVTGH